MPCSDERASSVCLSSRRFARCKRTAFSATRRARHSVLLPPTTCTTCSDTISRCAGQSNMPKVERPKRADGSHIIDVRAAVFGSPYTKGRCAHPVLPAARAQEHRLLPGAGSQGFGKSALVFIKTRSYCRENSNFERLPSDRLSWSMPIAAN